MSSLSNYAAGLRHWLTGVLNRRALILELQACPKEERNRIARDLGMSELDLLRPVSNPLANDLMSERLEQLYLSPDYIELFHLATYRDMRRVCSSCQSWRRCARDLADANVDGGMRDYCPNAETMDALVIESSRCFGG